MAINLLALPVDNLLKVLIKLKAKELVRLRRCKRKIDEFVEEHRFQISNKSHRGSDDVKIRIDITGENYEMLGGPSSVIDKPFEQLSALSFNWIPITFKNKSPIQTDVLSRLANLLELLKLVTGILYISSSDYNPSKEELNFATLIDYRGIDIRFESSDFSSEIFSYEIVQKPKDSLTLILNCESSPLEHVFDIFRMHKDVSISFSERNGEFAAEIARYTITKLLNSPFEAFPTVWLDWNGWYPLNSLFTDMKLLWKTEPKNSLTAYIYAKNLQAKILVVFIGYSSSPYESQSTNVYLIEKSKGALCECLDECLCGHVDEQVLDYLYESLFIA